MSDPDFNPPLFIKAGPEAQINTAQTPWFLNEGGAPLFLQTPPSHMHPIEVVPTDPAIAMGNEVIVAKQLGFSTSSYGNETQLGFAAREVVFEPLWATREVAAAFGITLVEPGQIVQVQSPIAELQLIEYEYGAFAGHWTPYQKVGNNVVSVVCTDLEHHDFPHVFASTDPTKPLVTSVGRYWPKRGVIRLADLWVPQGCALYIPPKPHVPDAEVIDLHNNRNSARACWGDIFQNSITTYTLLQASGGFFHWYWNAMDTQHSQPPEIR